MSAADITFFATQLSYGVALFPLDIVLLILPFVYREKGGLSNFFYYLIQCQAVVNIVTYVNSWVALRSDGSILPYGLALKIFLEEHIPGILTHLRILTIACYYMQMFTSLMLNFCRVTLAFRLDWDDRWKRTWRRVPFITVVLGVSVHLYIWIRGPATVVQLLDGKLQVTPDPDARLTLNIFNLIVGSVCLLANEIGGLAVIWRLNKNKKKSTANRSSVEKPNDIMRKAVFTLLYTTFVILGNVVTLGLSVLFAFTGSSYPWVTSRLLPFTSDMVSLSMPIFLALCDVNVQRILKGWKKMIFKKMAWKELRAPSTISIAYGTRAL